MAVYRPRPEDEQYRRQTLRRNSSSTQGAPPDLSGLTVTGVLLLAAVASPAERPAALGRTAAPAGTSPGWCGLYPGTRPTTPELGLVSLSADGTKLTVQTQDADSGVVPATSFACLTATPISEIVHRLQDEQCAKAGGVWFPIAGGSQVIDLAEHPQFLDAQFTVQVAANKSANSSNGDAFYNNVAVDSTSSGGGDT